MRDSKRDTDVKNRLLDSVGEVEGGMIWENGIETCILSCKKWTASLGSIKDTGCLGLVHWDDPERWYEEGGGRGVQDWELTYTRGRFMSMYGKTIQYCKVKKQRAKTKQKKNHFLQSYQISFVRQHVTHVFSARVNNQVKVTLFSQWRSLPVEYLPQCT